MKDELMITTKLSRRLFCQLVARINKIRDEAIEDIEEYKDKEDSWYRDKYFKAVETEHETGMILEALLEED